MIPEYTVIAKPKMKTIGVLGGMSLTAAKHYFEQLQHYTQARLGADHSCELVMHSFLFEEVKRILETEDELAMFHFLLPATVGLIGNGAEIILISCASLNNVAEQLARAVKKPVVPYADYAGRFIRQLKFTKAGLLGSRSTMEQGFFKQRLTARYGIEVIVPGAKDRHMVHRAIMTELVRDVCSDKKRAALEEVVDELAAAGAQCVILGCTELSLLLSKGKDPDEMKVPLIDVTSLQVQGAVEWALGS